MLWWKQSFNQIPSALIFLRKSLFCGELCEIIKQKRKKIVEETIFGNSPFNQLLIGAILFNRKESYLKRICSAEIKSERNRTHRYMISTDYVILVRCDFFCLQVLFFFVGSVHDSEQYKVTYGLKWTTMIHWRTSDTLACVWYSKHQMSDV